MLQGQNIIEVFYSRDPDRIGISHIVFSFRDSTEIFCLCHNGIGFDLRQTHRGIGLSNIYERTRFYNGIADIQTAPGKGCCLNISIPVL